MIKKGYFFVLLLSILSLIISFKFGLDTATGPQIDFNATWLYVYDLNSDLSNLYSKRMGIDYNKHLHYPLHYLIISRFDFFVENKESFLKIFFLISLFIPVVFYKCLVLKFENIEKKNLILLATLIYLLPSYRSSAMWGNLHITGLFFLLFSIFFYLKWNKKNENSFNLNIILQITFLALASYTAQYYVILFPFFFIKYIKFLSIKNFLYLSLFTFILSIPGIIFLILNPLLLFFAVLGSRTTNFLSSILVTSSIMGFYLIPFFLKSLITDIESVKKKYFCKKNIPNLIISMIIILSLSPYFLYIGNVGGGIFLKLSRYLFNNEIIFFLSSFAGFLLLLPLINNKIENFFLILLLLISFSSGIYIFHKYFEPMFLIILFCLFDKEITKYFLKKNMLLIYIYFIAYLLAAIIQSKYNLITF